jgi:hypothetical protein
MLSAMRLSRPAISIPPASAASCLLLLCTFAAAQSPPMPPDYAGVQVHIPGVFVTPVPNAPFTADVQIISHQVLPGGTEEIRTTVNHIARDSAGRIYNERRRLVSTAYKGEPALLSGHIFDPATRLNIFYEPPTRLAREATLPPAVADRQMPTRAPVPLFGETSQPGIVGIRPGSGLNSAPRVIVTDLGDQVIDDTTLHGTQKQRIIDATASGTGMPVTITDEYWYSPDLSVYLIVKHDDPRAGEQIVAVTHIDRQEPPAARFDVPAGYKIVDETPPGP